MCPCSKTQSETVVKAIPADKTLKKLYYPNPTPPRPMVQNNIFVKENNNKKNVNSGSILRYYYNNFTRGKKDTNIYQNAVNRRKNELAFLHGKAPFSSTKRPLSIRLSTPKHMGTLFNRNLKSDSQKRPLLLQASNNYEYQRMPYFQVTASQNGYKISTIYTISENVEKFGHNRKNLYISSNSRPLFIRK